MGGLIGFDAAVERLAGLVQPLPAESVPLDRAAGRTLAAPLIARISAPRVAISAMDGYAVDDASTRPLETLAVVGEARPGVPFAGEVGPGQAVRIFTGAPVPAGADRVIVQEHALRDGLSVRFTEGYGPSRHIRSVGSDFAQGAVLLEAGTVLTPAAMVAAAAADRAELPLVVRPRVAILGTGDELVAPGSAADQPYAIPESVTFGVAALVAASGGEIVARSTCGDDLAALSARAGTLLEMADLVVVTGGASVGERDFGKAMFAPHGLELGFAGVAIKPGKPVWCGTAQGRLVLGLPGNPTSALVTATLFLRPLLAALQGRSWNDTLRWRELPLAVPLPATGARETFVRATWQAGGLQPLGNQDSGAQAALAQADWLIRCPAGTGPRGAGETVSALPL